MSGSPTQNEWNRFNNLERKLREANKNLGNYYKTTTHLYNKLNEMKRRLKSKSPLRRSYHINKRTLKAIQNQINTVEKNEFHAAQMLNKALNNRTNLVKKVYKRVHPNNPNLTKAGFWFIKQKAKRTVGEIAKINLPQNVKNRLPPGVPPHLPMNITREIIKKYLKNELHGIP
jgi:exonuclease VII large subunit